MIQDKIQNKIPANSDAYDAAFLVTCADED